MLGVQWETKTDILQFDIGEAARKMQDLTSKKAQSCLCYGKIF